MSRLKERKRAREKRQRWRKREQNRRKRLMVRTALGLENTPLLPATREIVASETMALVSEAEEKIGELTVPMTETKKMWGESIFREYQVRMRVWERIRDGFLKLRYPPSYIGDVVVIEAWWLKWLRKIFAVGRRGG